MRRRAAALAAGVVALAVFPSVPASAGAAPQLCGYDDVRGRAAASRKPIGTNRRTFAAASTRMKVGPSAEPPRAP